MPHIAIIGSGPAGYYTAEAAVKQWGDAARIDMFDALPVPYGLIRSGVAPDHQSIKAVSRRFETTALGEQVRFIGNVRVGAPATGGDGTAGHVTIDELAGFYDAIVLATGAPHDRKLGLVGEDLKNVFGSAAFVGWYNGHPDFARLDPDLSGETAVVIGNGNVALDVARILAKTPGEFAGSDIVRHAFDLLAKSRIRRIIVLGRRGPHQIAMTPKELGELAHLARATPVVDPADLPPIGEDAALDPGQRKSVNHLRAFAAIDDADRAAKPLRIEFDFLAAPRAILGDDVVTGVEVERTRIDGARAVGTNETYVIPAGLVIACIGYQTSPIAGVPYDDASGRFANIDGRIVRDTGQGGLYCVGWARRGPSGTIGTNRPDGFAVVERIAEDIGMDESQSGRRQGVKAGGAGFDRLASERGLRPVTFDDWRRIDEAEIANARDGSPREKFVHLDRMLEAGAKA